MNEPTGVAADAANILFNLPDYRVISTTVTAGRRQVIIETDQLPGCPSCGVIASRGKERRFQRLRDIPVAGTVDVLWSKYRWYCEEPACDRLSFFESTPQVPRRARSTGRLRNQVRGCGHPLGPGRIGNSCGLRRVLVDASGGTE
ncbi:transposase family protein [Arthrobacter sp. D1-17]